MDALVNFRDGLQEVELLSRQDPLREHLGSSNLLSAAIQRASCVLLVSHFEGFIKELAEEMTQKVAAGHPPVSRLPVPLRELHSLPRLDDISRCNDPAQRLVLLKRLAEIAALWHPTATTEARHLAPRKVSRVVTSARPAVIDNLFNLFGAVSPVCDGDIDVLDSLGQEMTPIHIRAKLDEIVDCRNAIAHGVADRKVTHTDVDRYANFLSALSRRLSAKGKSAVETILNI